MLSVNEIKLGKVEAFSKAPWEFYITTDDTWMISRLSSSCGCTTPKRDGKKIYGEVIVPSGPINGNEISKSVYVTFRKDRQRITKTVKIYFEIIKQTN